MTINNWLIEATKKLNLANIASARLDSLIFLEDVLNRDRSWLLAHPEVTIDNSKYKKLDKLISRRVHHEPMAYIRQKTEFYGREFFINQDVLVPRPESESIIDLLKELGNSQLFDSIIDIGTGSGILGITAALELSPKNLTLSDISQSALKVARRNSKLKRSKAIFLNSDLLTKNHDFHDVLICNLPYVPDKHRLNEAATFEPKIAIFGGTDGLDLYRKLYYQILKSNQYPKYIFTESMPSQHENLASISKKYGYDLYKQLGYAQAFIKSN